LALKSESPAVLQILDEIGISDLPDEWEIIRLESLLSEDRGIAVGVMYPGEHDQSGVPLIRAGDLAGNRIDPQPAYRISPAKHLEHRRTELSGGELLISLVGEVGRTALVPAAMAGWNAARAIAVLRFLDLSDAAYVRVCLRSFPLQHLMRAWSTTTVQATLNLKEVRQIPLPWPPPGERKAIAQVIGALDDKIELNRRMSETLEAMARALFKSWFVDFDPVRAKAEGRDAGLSQEFADLFPDSFEDSELGEIPRGWKVRTVDEFADVQGGTTPSTTKSEYWNGGTHAWATPKDLSGLSVPVLLGTERAITDQGLSQIGSGLLPAGTVLLSSRAPIGYLAIAEIPVAINQGFIAMVPNAGTSNLFLLLWASAAHDEIVSRANGSTFLEISKANFRRISIVAPPASVMEAFDCFARAFYQPVVSNTLASRSISSLRDSLLPKLFSGDLRLPEVPHFEEEMAG
jgi:type I restriction enzyme S subunit